MARTQPVGPPAKNHEMGLLQRDDEGAAHQGRHLVNERMDQVERLTLTVRIHGLVRQT